MKKLIITVIILVVVAAIIFAGLKLKSLSNKGVEVIVEQVERRDIIQVVTSFGSLSPEVEVDISSKVIGQIEKLHVDEGDTVLKGDTLVELERNRFVAAVSSAQASLRSSMSEVTRVKANLRQASETYRKTKAMFDKELVSGDALFQAETQVQVQEAMLESAKNNIERSRAVLDETRDDLDRTTITSPVSGVVIRLVAEEGENVITGTMNNAGSAIMTIAQLEAMEAVVEVDEADVVDLVIGQAARIEIDAFPDTFIMGEVARIANSARLQSVGGQETVANFEVKISIPEPIDGIRPGMSCSAEIEVRKADSVLSVPIQAVVAAKEILPFGEEKHGPEGPEKSRNGGKARNNNGFNKRKEAVFVIGDGVAHQKVVTTGIADDRYIEIEEGIEEGDSVVVGRYQALRELSDGDRVSLIDQSKSPGAKRKGGFSVRVN